MYASSKALLPHSLTHLHAHACTHVCIYIHTHVCIYTHTHTVSYPVVLTWYGSCEVNTARVERHATSACLRGLLAMVIVQLHRNSETWVAEAQKSSSNVPWMMVSVSQLHISCCPVIPQGEPSFPHVCTHSCIPAYTHHKCAYTYTNMHRHVHIHNAELSILFTIILYLLLFTVMLYIDDEKPQPAQFLSFLTNHCKLWWDIGLLLELMPSVLDQIEHDNQSQRDCFRVTLQKWLQLDNKATWGRLELAITNANRLSLGYESLSSLTSKTSCLYVW